MRNPVGIDPLLLLHLLRRPPFLVALVLDVAGFALHLLALRSLPLFLAQAVVSSGIAVTAVASARVLTSPLGRPEVVAVVGQTVAPALVGLGLLGDRVRDRAGPLVVLGLVLAVSGCAALARRDPTLVS